MSEEPVKKKAKKKKQEDAEDGGPGWIVSFADLMTLLFATFVVLYGLKSEGEPRKVMGVAYSIREAFIEVPDVIPDNATKGPQNTGRTIFKAFRGETPIRPIVKPFKRTESVMIAIDRDKSQVEVLLDQISRSKEGMDYNLRQAMNVDYDERGLVLKLQGAYFFAPGKYQLSREGEKRLRNIGKLIRRMGRNVVIEGHTDARPAEGIYTNYELGALRAGHAAKVFIKEVGISPLKIQTASYAENRPIASNKTEEGRRQNRRIEIKITYD